MERLKTAMPAGQYAQSLQSPKGIPPGALLSLLPGRLSGSAPSESLSMDARHPIRDEAHGPHQQHCQSAETGRAPVSAPQLGSLSGAAASRWPLGPASGSSTVNVDPAPTALSAYTEPPSAWTSSRTM